MITEEQAANARAWVEALRSGKFKQGNGYLKSIDEDGIPRHCCLGVLCELQGVKEHPATRNGTAASFFFKEGGPEIARTNFPNADWFERITGLPMQGARDEPALYGRRLADWNDHGESFATIADAIEAEIKLLTEE